MNKLSLTSDERRELLSIAFKLKPGEIKKVNLKSGKAIKIAKLARIEGKLKYDEPN